MANDWTSETERRSRRRRNHAQVCLRARSRRRAEKTRVILDAKRKLKKRRIAKERERYARKYFL